MKKEIIAWYAGKSLHIHKQIELGEVFNLSKRQMEAALEHCYNKIVAEGKPVPDNQIAWYVRNVAKDIDTTDIIKEHEAIERAKEYKQDAETFREKFELYRGFLRRAGESRSRASKKLKAAHQDALQNLKAKHEDAVKRLKAEHEAEVERRDAEIRNKNKEIENKSSQVKHLEKRCADIETIMEKSMERLQRAYERELSDTREQLGTKTGESSEAWGLLERMEQKTRRYATIIYILSMLLFSHAGFWLL